jgi:serine/threonine-protein kinase RsbW
MEASVTHDRLVISNSPAELRRMSRWLQDFAFDAELRPDVTSVIDLCANEVVVNIISYAYESAGPREIALELDAIPGGVRLVVSDDGRPFNPLQAPDHVPPLRLDEATIGGLGILLVRRMASRCEYRRDQDRNIVSIEAVAGQRPDLVARNGA